MGWVSGGPRRWAPAAFVASAAFSGCLGDVELFFDGEMPPPPAAGTAEDEPSAAPIGADPLPSLSETASPDGSAEPSPPVAMAADPGAAPDPGPSAEPPGAEPIPLQPDTDATGGARVCRAPAGPVLIDFGRTNHDASQATFGDFVSVLSGGTFVYPEAVAPEAGVSPPGVGAEPALGLRSDVSDGDWHISGIVDSPAGFGLFLDCQQLDASRFVGLAFRLEGELPAPGTLTFVVGSAANQVSRAWLLGSGEASPGPSFGRCTPLETAFDGSCLAARITLPVRREGDEVRVRFADLAGGSPEPRLDPAELTSIQWALPPPSTGADGASVPYAVELRLDDIRFISAE